MSDTPTSPDWWLASDGKWYPPTADPGWSEAVRPPPSRSNARWAQGAWWVTAVLGAATAATAWPAREAARIWVADPTVAHAEDWDDVDLGAAGAFNLLAIALLAALILMIVWMWSTHKHQTAVDPERRRSWGAGWAIAGWFIPIGHLFVPKLVLQEIERVALGRNDDPDPDPDAPTPVRPRLSATGHLYWVAWIIGLTAVGVSTILWDGVVDVGSVADLDGGAVLDAYLFRLVGGAALVVAGVAGALHLRHLQRLLTDRS